MTVRLFAGLRDRFGPCVELDLEAPCTAGQIEQGLQSIGCWLPGTRIAIARKFAFADHVAGPADEVAALPPVTGG
jgi:hypothetical protein